MYKAPTLVRCCSDLEIQRNDWLFVQTAVRVIHLLSVSPGQWFVLLVVVAGGGSGGGDGGVLSLIHI